MLREAWKHIILFYKTNTWLVLREFMRLDGTAYAVSKVVAGNAIVGKMEFDFIQSSFVHACQS